MRSITITTYSGRFRVNCSGGGQRSYGRDAWNAGEAAAIAVEYANNPGPYVILGHKDALDMIPVELRDKSK